MEACSAALYGECTIECERATIYKKPDWFGPWIPGDFKSQYCKDYKPPYDPNSKKPRYKTVNMFENALG